MNLDDFSKNISKFVSDTIKDFKKEHVEEAAEELRTLLRSGKATRSVKKINRLFEKSNKLDEDGRVMVISDPSKIADNIIIVDSVIIVALTQDQNMWVRADKIFGDNILAELGIKYRQNES